MVHVQIFLYTHIVEECESGEIRLVGGVTNSTGRLEVCGNEIWGRVCNRFQYWGTENARVVCHQLGFSDFGKKNIHTALHDLLSIIFSDT